MTSYDSRASSARNDYYDTHGGWAPPPSPTPTESSALIPPPDSRYAAHIGPRPPLHPDSSPDPQTLTQFLTHRRAALPTYAGSEHAQGRSPASPPRPSAFKAYAENDSASNANGVQLVLLNTGSVARDHLAAERTYLAYVRTSLALSSASVALTQLLRLGAHTKALAAPIGAGALLLGLLILAFGTRRFFVVQRALVTGYFPPSMLEIAFTSIVLASLVILVFGVVIAGRER